MSLPPLTPEQSVKPPRFELRISLLFAAIFLPIGIHLPYFPLWLEGEGFSAGEIAVILSAPIFLRVFAMPVASALADRADDRVHVLIGLTVATLLVSLGYFLPARTTTVLVVSLALAIAWSPHGPIADSLAVSGVRRFGADYSRMRIWGSIAFLAANLAGGVVLAWHGAAVVPWLISGGLVVTCAAALWAPRLGRPRRPSQLSAVDLPLAGRVLSDPYFLSIAIGCGIVSASHGFLYAFGSIYWKGLGVAADMVGLLWAVSIVAEVVLFFAFRPLFGRMSAPTILLVASLAAVLRWAAMPFLWQAGLGVPGFAAVQALHGFSTGLTMLGLQRMIAETVPEDRMGAAQGVAVFASGAGMAAVTLASGPLYIAWGAGGFLVMAAIGLVGAGLALAAARSAPKDGFGR